MGLNRIMEEGKRELFKSAKAVRLRSHHSKYLLAEEDKENVRQDCSGSSRNARWTVEFPDVASPTSVRLKSCYDRYLFASSEPFLLGMTGRKVLHAISACTGDATSVEWEPVRDGFQIRLKTRNGHFLRANGGLPPWRNSVTSDTPHRTSPQNWVLWDVEIRTHVPVKVVTKDEQSQPSVASTSSSILSPKVSTETYYYNVKGYYNPSFPKKPKVLIVEGSDLMFDFYFDINSFHLHILNDEDLY